MTEIWQEILAPANLIYTTLLGFSIAYWLLVIIGALDIELFDFDIDIDDDIDVDADIDTEVSVSGNPMMSVLSFFNFGRVPFMIIYSFATIAMWLMVLLLNRHFGDNTWWFGIMMFIPALFVGLTITKLVTQPLIPMFDEMGKGEEPVNYIGKTGILKVSATKERFGKAEIHVDHTILFIDVKIGADDALDFIDRGAIVMVTNISDNEKYYYVTRYQT